MLELARPPSPFGHFPHLKEHQMGEEKLSIATFT
jgi:hypothetical protein